MTADYIRLCPTCSAENAPDTMRCTCGALLAGIDLSARQTEPSAAPLLPEETPSTAARSTSDDSPLCPHADCGQPNPPGGTRCLYCDRPLDEGDDGLSDQAAGCLISLPSALRERYRIEHPLPATGAEAELLVVSPLAGGEQLIAKIYRHGIHPNREVQERIARIDPGHRVRMLENGLSDGFTYELMEYCRAGSLRDLLQASRPNPAELGAIIKELCIAIAGVHQAGLIHRDLKPENILVRSTAPLDLILTDFSIASLQNATLRFTGVARTLAYGAPETLSGVIDSKADWWSLGMILLEIALGEHPFHGLSDAVILHQLTTRQIDLAAVDDAKLRKLLRGLLVRDPKSRWGNDEISRWLADDPDLPEAAGAESPLQAGRPYQIGDEQCFTPDQLAVGLARHWQLALADIDNGMLMNWLRTELKDQNRVRFLIDLNMERQLHVDIRLLRLIIDLAPGIPPVWRGDSLKLRRILQQADRALKNDAEAAQWLDTLYEFRVLDAYAAAGNAESADIVKRWHGALEQFNTAWQATQEQIRAARQPDPDRVTLYDEAVFGNNSGPLRPSPRQLHARLLALSYDPAWAERLRQQLQRVVSQLAIDAPWLLAVGNIEQLPAPHLLALESLLPEARKQSKRNQEKARQADVDAQALTRRLQTDCAMAIARLQQTASVTFFTDAQCAELQQSIEAFAGLAGQVRAQGQTSPEYQKLRKQMARLEPSVSRMRRQVDALLERRAQNRGWFNQQTMGFYGMLLFVVPLFISQRWFYPLLIIGGLFAAWRFLPNYFSLREIRALAEKLRAY